jgi:hypothetical protein
MEVRHKMAISGAGLIVAGIELGNVGGSAISARGIRVNHAVSRKGCRRFYRQG